MAYLSSVKNKQKKNCVVKLGDYDINKLAETGRRIWNEALGRIKVEGGTENDKTVLYSSFYRTFERPICMSEAGVVTSVLLTAKYTTTTAHLSTTTTGFGTPTVLHTRCAH